MEYIVVGVGGIFGSITRYALGRFITERSNSIFPLGTFIINITGAFLLGIVTTFQSDKTLYWLFGEGFLGAYTTFSTFMYEGFNLFQDKEKLNAIRYVLGSLLLGIAGFTIGLKIGTLIQIILK